MSFFEAVGRSLIATARVLEVAERQRQQEELRRQEQERRNTITVTDYTVITDGNGNSMTIKNGSNTVLGQTAQPVVGSGNFEADRLLAQIDELRANKKAAIYITNHLARAEAYVHAGLRDSRDSVYQFDMARSSIKTAQHTAASFG